MLQGCDLWLSDVSKEFEILVITVCDGEYMMSSMGQHFVQSQLITIYS